MTKVQFLQEIDHIIDSGYNEIRISELYDKFYPETGTSFIEEGNKREAALRNEKWELLRQNKDMLGKIQVLENTGREVGERFRSKLMSVYYMIDSFTYQSTHRDKNIVVQSIKGILERMVNEGDNLPIKIESDLPF